MGGKAIGKAVRGRAMLLALASLPLRPVARPTTLRLGRAFARMNDQNVEYPVQKTTNEWMKSLSDEEYYILRQKGTERPGTGEYNKFYPKDGYFACAGCLQPLYSAKAKFDSGCGWPAFDKIIEGSVVTETDSSLGMTRVEIMCSSCGGHLGHVFEGEGFTPTMERHCVNSLSVKYVDAPIPDGKAEEPVLPTRTELKESKSSILSDLFNQQ
uniref:Peptide-methionine (R)-S-oxide reductase n=1 Tax=Prymnesium polylepis TaxID=72548 RepID=A0A7S4JWD0_9EUKA